MALTMVRPVPGKYVYRHCIYTELGKENSPLNLSAFYCTD